MTPQYSILLCNPQLSDYRTQIKEWLHTGIKVIWFGSSSDVLELKKEHGSFCDIWLPDFLEEYAEKSVLPCGTYAESIVERFAHNTTWGETGDMNMRQYLSHA